MKTKYFSQYTHEGSHIWIDTTKSGNPIMADMKDLVITIKGKENTTTYGGFADAAECMNWYHEAWRR